MMFTWLKQCTYNVDIIQDWLTGQVYQKPPMMSIEDCIASAMFSILLQNRTQVAELSEHIDLSDDSILECLKIRPLCEYCWWLIFPHDGQQKQVRIPGSTSFLMSSLAYVGR